jgi:hypothetical protein
MELFQLNSNLEPRHVFNSGASGSSRAIGSSSHRGRIQLYVGNISSSSLLSDVSFFVNTLI